MKRTAFSRFIIMLSIIAIVSTFTFTVLAQEPQKETTVKKDLVPEDHYKVKRVGSPAISPDGKWVAYTISETDLETEKSETRIWMIPFPGGEAMPMTAKGVSSGSPQWSPDGKFLSFTSSRNDSKSQVWTLNMQGGEAQQLTEVKQGIGGFKWSPDGKKILLYITDKKPEPKPEIGKDGKLKKKKAEPFVIDRLQFKADYVGYLDRLRTHLYVFDVASKTVKQITSGDYDESGAVWSPDGKLIAFTSNRTEEPDGNENSNIWIVSADNTDKGKTLKQLTTNEGPDGSPAWSPDGKYIAYTTTERFEKLWYATQYIAQIPVEGGKHELITSKLDRNVYSPKYSTDGKSVLFSLEDSGEQQLAEVVLSNKKINILISGQKSIRGYTQNKSGKIAAMVTSHTMPSEVHTLTNGKLNKLTKVNDKFIKSVNLALHEEVHYKSKDGTEIEAFVYKPHDYNTAFKYPTILWIHGGPTSQYDYGFNFTPNLYTANGYVVIHVNPRGSTGYGEDFAHAIFGDWGNKDFYDVMGGVDYLIEKGVTDPDRLGVGGWSYGGILTNNVITKTTRFHGAISGASEVLYRTNYGHDVYQYVWEKELGLPWENAAHWDKISPFTYVTKIKTPTLMIGGGSDWNVPIINSEQMYQALKRLGIETQLVVYPGEHHGIRKPAFVIDRYNRYLGWFGKYVKRDTAKEEK